VGLWLSRVGGGAAAAAIGRLMSSILAASITVMLGCSWSRSTAMASKWAAAEEALATLPQAMLGHAKVQVM
jgi:hypothetical protein